MTDLEKIRKGVEELESRNNCGTSDFIESKRIAFKQVLELIDEIENDKKDNNLKNEIKKEYLKRREYGGDKNILVVLNQSKFEDVARHFTKWQEEQTLKRSMDEGTLTDWYCNSIDPTIPPCWTPEHIEELLKDFYVIPKTSL